MKLGGLVGKLGAAKDGAGDQDASEAGAKAPLSATSVLGKFGGGGQKAGGGGLASALAAGKGLADKGKGKGGGASKFGKSGTTSIGRGGLKKRKDLDSPREDREPFIVVNYPLGKYGADKDVHLRGPQESDPDPSLDLFVVTSVGTGGLAAQAGVLIGAYVMLADGKPVHSVTSLVGARRVVFYHHHELRPKEWTEEEFGKGHDKSDERYHEDRQGKDDMIHEMYRTRQANAETGHRLFKLSAMATRKDRTPYAPVGASKRAVGWGTKDPTEKEKKKVMKELLEGYEGEEDDEEPEMTIQDFLDELRLQRMTHVITGTHGIKSVQELSSRHFTDADLKRMGFRVLEIARLQRGIKIFKQNR